MYFFFGDWLGEGGGRVSRPGGQGSTVDVLSAEHKYFRPGTRPGGSATGVTQKLFMYQMFMCILWPLASMEKSCQRATALKWGKHLLIW